MVTECVKLKMAVQKVLQLRTLQKAGNETNAIEESLAEMIDELPKVPGIAEIGVETMGRICSLVPIIKIETAKGLISQFHAEFGVKSASLLGFIECGPILERALEALGPFEGFPLIRELVRAMKSFVPGEGEIDVDLAGMLADARARIVALEEELSEKTAAKEVPKIKPKRPDNLNEDIHKASEKGDTDTVKFLLSNDPSLANKRDEDVCFFTSKRHRFTLLPIRRLQEFFWKMGEMSMQKTE
jgi:hypothetical protein